MLNKLKKSIVQKALSKVKSYTWSTFWGSEEVMNRVDLSNYPEFLLSENTPLCSIMNTEKSDKGNGRHNNGWHNYTKVYFHLFNDLNVVDFFELGVGTNHTDVPSNMGEHGTPGASLRGWRKYFPNAKIWSADIDERVLINEDSIASFYCDQTDKQSIESLWQNEKIAKKLDVIVDDGLHEFYANVTFFENSIHKLKPNGIYVVEDINNFELGLWKEKIESTYINQYPNLLFRMVCIPNLFNALDNNLLVIYAV